tara:strand:- start:84 stop:266 length:183 start_codon:yes stop_codon:yes gene_type:complete
MGLAQGSPQNATIKWTIKDTEFLLRLVNNSSIPGADIEQAADVIKKIKEIHSKLLNSKAE